MMGTGGSVFGTGCGEFIEWRMRPGYRRCRMGGGFFTGAISRLVSIPIICMLERRRTMLTTWSGAVVGSRSV